MRRAFLSQSTAYAVLLGLLAVVAFTGRVLFFAAVCFGCVVILVVSADFCCDRLRAEFAEFSVFGRSRLGLLLPNRPLVAELNKLPTGLFCANGPAPPETHPEASTHVSAATNTTLILTPMADNELVKPNHEL